MNLAPSGFMKTTIIKSEIINTDKVILAATDTDSRHTYYMNNGTYYKDNCGSSSAQFKNHRFRYLHEFYHFHESYNWLPYPAANSELHLNLRLQYRSSRWRGAGEKRNMTVNIGHNIKFYNDNNGIELPLYGAHNNQLTFNCSGDVDILVKWTQGSYLQTGISPKFEIEAWGTITHEFTGGYSYWSNNFDW